MFSKSHILVTGVAILGVIVGAAPTHSQSFWLDPARESSLSLEILKIDFDQPTSDFTFTTAAYCLNGKFRLDENIWFVGEMPFAHFDLDYEAADYPAQNAFGNPFLGLRRTFNDGDGALEFGIRPPIAEEDNPSASFYGISSDLDRYSAFIPDVFAAKVHLDYTHIYENGLFVRGRVGPSLFLFTEDTRGDDFELLLSAGGQMGLRAEKVRVWTGVNTITVITEDSFVGDDRIVFEIALGANLDLGLVEPGAFVRFPVITDYQELVSSVFGLNVTANLR